MSLPPYNYFIINFITFSLFFVFIFNQKKFSSKKKYFYHGWLFGFGYFLLSLYWITISLTFDETFKFLIPFSLVLVPAFLAIFYGIIVYLFYIFSSEKLVESFLIFSVLFGILEFIRGYIFTGFPWNLIAFSFLKNLNFIQILSVIGTYSFNLICISLFTVPAIFFLRKTKKEIFVCIFFLLVSMTFLLFGVLQNKKFNSTQINKHDYIIRSIGSNIPLDRFFSQDNEYEIIKELILLSNPEKIKPTVFIWPEGIIPHSYISELKVYEDLFYNEFGDNHLIILGANSFKNVNEKNNYYNSMGIFDNKLNVIQSYNKINLVPFGEFIPFENILSKVGLKTITNNYESFSKGLERKVIEIDEKEFSFRLLPLICYEIIYSGEITNKTDFDYIINISEDGWFGDSIGPKQHFSHSIFRAIENRKYLIRSANNGISSIISPVGKIEKMIDFGKSGSIDFTESKIIKSAPFLKYGNKIFILIILLYIFLIFSFNRFVNE